MGQKFASELGLGEFRAVSFALTSLASAAAGDA